MGGFGFGYGYRNRSSRGEALGGATATTFIWLGSTLTGAPALSGSPAGAVHLNVSETSNVTRGGVTMRSVNLGPFAGNNSGADGVPQWQIGNSFQGVRFELRAGNWEFAVIASSASFGGGVSGTVTIKDDPAGANVTKQSLPFSGTGIMLADTDNSRFANPGTMLADAVGALSYAPVTVSDLGGGNGAVQLYADGTNVSAIALRRIASPPVAALQFNAPQNSQYIAVIFEDF